MSIRNGCGATSGCASVGKSAEIPAGICSTRLGSLISLTRSGFIPRERTGESSFTLSQDSEEELCGKRMRALLTGSIAAVATLGAGAHAATQPATQTTLPPELARRALGRTGVDVTILNLGTWMS